MNNLQRKQIIGSNVNRLKKKLKGARFQYKWRRDVVHRNFSPVYLLCLDQNVRCFCLDLFNV